MAEIAVDSPGRRRGSGGAGDGERAVWAGLLHGRGQRLVELWTGSSRTRATTSDAKNQTM